MYNNLPNPNIYNMNQNYNANSLQLPFINNKNYHTLQREQNDQIQRALSFAHNRMIRSIPSTNPFRNYPLYPAEVSNFCYNYPQSLYYYRPIRYFFQRPVQLDEDNCFPHQKAILQQLKDRDEQIRNSYSGRKAKYGIPRKIEDIVKQGEVIHYPKATIVSAANLKQKQEEYNQLVRDMEKLGPGGQRRIHQRNDYIKDRMRKIIMFNQFLLDMRKFTRSAKTLKDNAFVHVQAAKANINEIKNFLLKMLKNVEKFATRYLGEKIEYTSTNKRVREDSIFLIKSFIHQLFMDLSSSFCNKTDIPEGMRSIFRQYIKEKAMLPPHFLSTFEFNRLEFDIHLRLNRMNSDRQALVIGFLIFYRVLLLDIMRYYLESFRKLETLGNPVPDVFDKQFKKKGTTPVPTSNVPTQQNPKKAKNTDNNMITNSTQQQMENEQGEQNGKKVSPNILSGLKDEQQTQLPTEVQRVELIKQMRGPDAEVALLRYRKQKEQIRENLKYNFNFLSQLLHYIVKSAFEKNNPIYRDYFKEKHLYGRMVFRSEPDDNLQLTDDNNNDDIELIEGIINPSVDCEAFIADNSRWIHMYQLNTIQFCKEFANIVMDEE